MTCPMRNLWLDHPVQYMQELKRKRPNCPYSQGIKLYTKSKRFWNLMELIEDIKELEDLIHRRVNDTDIQENEEKIWARNFLSIYQNLIKVKVIESTKMF